jgi:hypothetical protein
VGIVGQVNKAFVRQFFLQSLQHAQATNPAVKDADGAPLRSHGVTGLKKGRLRGLFELGYIRRL